MKQSPHFTILHTTHQLCCQGMCKNLQRLDNQKWRYSKTNFPFELRVKIVSEMGVKPVNERHAKERPSAGVESSLGLQHDLPNLSGQQI